MNQVAARRRTWATPFASVMPGVSYVQTNIGRSGLVDGGADTNDLEAAAEVMAGYSGPRIAPVIRREFVRVRQMPNGSCVTELTRPFQRVIAWRVVDAFGNEVDHGGEILPASDGQSTLKIPGQGEPFLSWFDALVVSGHGGIVPTGLTVEHSAEGDVIKPIRDSVAGEDGFVPVAGETLLWWGTALDGQWAFGVNALITGTGDSVQLTAETLQWETQNAVFGNWANTDHEMAVQAAVPSGALSNVAIQIIKRSKIQVNSPGRGAFQDDAQAVGGMASLTYGLTRQIKRFAIPSRTVR